MNNQRRRFRPRQQKNSFRRRNGSNINPGGGSSYFQGSSGNNNFHRNGSSNNPFNVEKMIQKYQQLGKDALSSGDPILSENYFQHADHFSRKLKELNAKTKDSVSVKEKEIKTENSQS